MALPRVSEGGYYKEEEKEYLNEPISKEFDSTDKAIEPIRYQEVIGPNLYEAEFGLRIKDVIFHFWPYGYHEAEERNKVPPRFKKNFPDLLKKNMNNVFGEKSIEIHEDPDMGAWFVRAKDWGESPFYKEKAIRVCEALFLDMGGKP